MSFPERYAVLIIIRKDFVLHMYKIVPEMVGYTNELGISMEKYVFKAIWFIIKGRYSQYSQYQYVSQYMNSKQSRRKKTTWIPQFTLLLHNLTKKK